LDYELIGQPDYWRNLIPELTISSAVPTVVASQHATVGEIASHDRFIDEGYLVFDSFISKEVTDRLLAGIERLRATGWLPVFSFLYDEYWQLFAEVSDIVTSALGTEARMMPDFWTWFVEPTSDDAGWPPHREKLYDTLLPDGLPKCMTAWISLTNADPLNGCLYFLPANRDPDYRNFGKPFGPVDLQDVRAVPAPRGSVVIWNERLVHWGARSSKYAREPRVSIACEFQRGDVGAFSEPLLPLGTVPPFEMRWALVGRQLIQYKNRNDFTDGTLTLANLMVEGGATVPPSYLQQLKDMNIAE
jgi:hypothetical protein